MHSRSCLCSACRSQHRQHEPGLQITEICVLITKGCFWSQRCKELDTTYCISPHGCEPLLLWLRWVSEDSKALCLFSWFPSFFSLFLWNSDIEDEDIQKQPHILRKLESHWACPSIAEELRRSQIYASCWSLTQRHPVTDHDKETKQKAIKI